MRWHDLYVAATATWFPRRVTVEEALARGWYDHGELADTRQAAVTVAEQPDEHPVEMASRAGRLALSRAALDPARVGLLLHATLFHQGVDIWNAAAYVQRRTGTVRARAFELRQACNGGAAAVELAAEHLLARPDHPAALVTTGDRFALPGFDRWRGDRGLLFGDGGTALVLSREGGFARLLATGSAGEPALEGIHRGDTPFAPLSQTTPIDLVQRRKEFLADAEPEVVTTRLNAGQRRAVEVALADAGVTLGDLTWVVTPNFGWGLLHRQCLDPLGLPVSRSAWEWGRTVGHLGPGDQIGGLDHLAYGQRLCAGDLVLLFGVGAGFAWTSVVLRILQPPHP
ncbi:3-Oxoacyl-(Acyl-carrier-protein (ACP)) synthase III domain protein [Carbonactinospora thermoautotrophica]|uniref:3-Oxoacyl-(Acyl-carrier-protein (ACP)) synthase III domain protein n=1 Tax=Carbonactinospora thermoautotrophica TaxID=1469144 RepID=A0A132MTI1_9ACTN|nr:ketoacyl-ACP synthase III family protein [Carbonactinospora thermoautotrophica]KWX01143.1 3-Oxoacyl-(Acyl-carrier-protein (ACP)) synthase III domain protein [Carbonactinospora thermoautotrophica]